MSTTRSDEDSFHPRVTLSSRIPSLADAPARMLQTGYKTPVKWPCPETDVRVGSPIYAGEWLRFEPHGPIVHRAEHAVDVASSTLGAGWGVPRVAGWAQYVPG